ncbi:MAG: hypothetical protein KF681_11965 [Bdellovibrionaceae bacterium]|nr:hypothetical protein [Pseudobdellovibrionaceae bacterium]
MALAWLSRLFFVFLFLISQASFALIESEREELRQIPDWMPYQGCQETKLLKQCFKWTQEECEIMTERVSQSCLNMHDSQFRDPRTGNLDFWKDKIKDCTIRDVRAKMRGRIVDSMICRNKGVYP